MCGFCLYLLRRGRVQMEPATPPSTDVVAFTKPEHLETHGWRLIPTDSGSHPLRLALSAYEYGRQLSRRAAGAEDAAMTPEEAAELKEPWMEIDSAELLDLIGKCPPSFGYARLFAEGWIRKRLLEAGVNVERLHLAAHSIVMSAEGQGPQHCHYDSSAYEQAKRKLSVLVFLDDCDSTHMPLLPASDMRCLFTKDEEWDGGNVKRLLKTSHFVSFRVRRGDILVFWNTVPHFAPRVVNQSERWLAFLLFSPVSYSEQPGQEMDQRRPQGTEVTRRPF
jgi:hypothetical protein